MNNIAAKRRWVQFSLRGMLAGMTILSLALGLVVNRVAKQRRAVAAIVQTGGTVFYDWNETAPRAVSTVGSPAGPAWLRKLLGDDYFQRPVWISYFGNAKNEGWVQAVGDLPSTKYLLLARGDITDEIFARLAPLPNLQELQLEGAAVTDQGFKHIGKFPRLRWLNASGTEVSDLGLSTLAALNLEELSLRDTGVSDAAAPVLATMKHLQKLDLRRSAVTEAGAERLRRALPNCKVTR